MLCQTPFGRESLPRSLEESICSESGRKSASRDLVFHHVLPSCIGHFCVATFCQPDGVSVSTELHRVRLAIAYHQNGCNRAQEKTHILQALVVIYLHVLARHVILPLSRFFPYHCFPLFLGSLSVPHGTLVSQRALTVDANRRLDKRNDPCSGALCPGRRLPSDATSSSIRNPPLVGFRPPSFLHDFLHFFPCLEQLNFMRRNPVL